MALVRWKNSGDLMPWSAFSDLQGELNRLMEDFTYDWNALGLSLIHISEPTRLLSISYAVFCLKKKKKQHKAPYHRPNQKDDKTKSSQ